MVVSPAVSLCRKLAKAGFETFWEVLQYYPKDYIQYQTQLQPSSHVIFQGTVSKCLAAGPIFQAEVKVDSAHNPVLHPPLHDLNLGPDSSQQPEESSSQEDEEEFLDDESSTYADSELDMDPSSTSDLELDEHGRTIFPEEASTSLFGSRTSTSSPPNGGSQPELQQGQETVELKKFLGRGFGSISARSMAGRYPVGSRVTMQCKVTMGAKPGQLSHTLCCITSGCVHVNELTPKRLAVSSILA